MSKEKLVPRLRYKEFNSYDDWKKFELGETVDFFDGKRKPLEASAREPGPYPYYGASGIIDYVKDYIFDEELILLSEDGANIIDRNYRIAFLARGKYWVNNHAHVLKAKKNYDNGFICEALEIINYEKYNTGTAQPKLNQEVCKKIDLIIPELNEQKKIYMFIEKIDEMIQLQQLKVNKVKDIKSAYLSEMFPKEGEKYPKKRFEGFTEPWKKRKLNSIANSFDTLRIPVTAADRIPGDTPYYGANGIQDYIDGYTHDGEYILLAEDGANDLENYPVHYVNGKVWVNNHAHVLQGNPGVLDNRFLMYKLKTINMEPYLVGGGRAKLNANTMMNIELLLPNLEEQSKIGTFFKNLDNQISIEEEKLMKLEKLKQAYLNDMFV